MMINSLFFQLKSVNRRISNVADPVLVLVQMYDEDLQQHLLGIFFFFFFGKGGGIGKKQIWRDPFSHIEIGH